MGLKQVELAKLLGVSEMSVVGWEKDRYLPSTRYLKKVKDILGVEG